MQESKKSGCSAVFFDGVDTRNMSVEVGEDNTVSVTQVVSGPGVEEVYDLAQKLTRIRLEAADAAHLAALLDFDRPDGALGRFVQEENHDVLDLMDFCDNNGVAYTKMALGAQ